MTKHKTAPGKMERCGHCGETRPSSSFRACIQCHAMDCPSCHNAGVQMCETHTKVAIVDAIDYLRGREPVAGVEFMGDDPDPGDRPKSQIVVYERTWGQKVFRSDTIAECLALAVAECEAADAARKDKSDD